MNSVKRLLTCFFIFGLSATAMATSLKIINHTGADIRIESLYNFCTGAIVLPSAPKYLKASEIFETPIKKVMHHYTVCGLGFCTSTAISVKEDREYVLDVDLQDGYLIRGTVFPDHWVGITSCEGI